MNEATQGVDRRNPGHAPADIAADMARESTTQWDSLSHLRLMTALEDEFGVSLTMDEIAAVRTPRQLQTIIDAQGVRSI